MYGASLLRRGSNQMTSSASDVDFTTAVSAGAKGHAAPQKQSDNCFSWKIYAAPGQTIYRQIILSIRIVLKLASPRTNATPTTGYPMINRRRFLTTSTLAAASLAAPGLVSRALAQSEALKIGVPVPISGAFAANGKFATI